MDIVHIASELAPIAKVGGLGDVIYGLAKAQVKNGHRVQIIIPKYDCLDYSALESLSPIGKLSIPENGNQIQTILWSARFHGLELVLVDPQHPQGYFHRTKIYGERDDNDRFLFFCKAVSIALENHPPDVIHLHDWPTAGFALFRKNGSKIVFTIHNMQHQGLCAPFNLERIGLNFNWDDLRDPKHPQALNLMKGAFHYSDLITAVSPTYAQEILTAEGGFGLDTYLCRYKHKLFGILNGIDTEYWNPETDPMLVANYSQKTRQEGKKKNKGHLQGTLNLTRNASKPLVVAITRLVEQKGPDLIAYGIQKTLELGGQFALLGTTRDPSMQRRFEQIKPHPDLAIRLDFNESLSHLLYAASDLFLMPSIFEPCGLSQMIALRYGSVPIVRATGGLKDTIFDGKNGFTFTHPDNREVAACLERAFASMKTEQWPALIDRGMTTDLSWDCSAEKYINIYANKTNH
ncbi:MAG: glycogen synthase [Verrucomicrobia bacterium]|nr:glycogen synthase [Verrucomicrobiota bacterium]